MTYADRGTVVIAIWTMLEVNIAVICACLTTIKPLLSRMFPCLFMPRDLGPGQRVVTIGRARQGPRNPLDSDTTADTCGSSEQSGKAVENVRMADLEA